MRHRTLWRATGAVFAVAAVLLIVAWLAFVPSAREPRYEFVKSWGGRGSGPGQFHDPTGVAVADAELFVADARNGRIQVFDLDGNFKREFGSPGDGPASSAGL